jgi:WD40 repeat protein
MPVRVFCSNSFPRSSTFVKSWLFKFSLLSSFAVLLATFIIGERAHSQTRRAPQIVTNLTDVVNAIQFSSDGRTIAIARGSRDDNRVELWDTNSGKLQRTIRGFDGPVWSVSFSPDGRTLVTASGGLHREKIAEKPTSQRGRGFNELKWWDPQTGDLKQRVEFPDEELVSLAAQHSPDGRLLAIIENRLSTGLVISDTPSAPYGLFPDSVRASRSVHFDARLEIIDARTGEVRLKLKGAVNTVQFLIYLLGRRGDSVSQRSVTQPRPPVFSPNGELIAAWKPDELRLWQTATGAEVLKTKKIAGWLMAVAFSPDGKLIAGAMTTSNFTRNHLEFKSEVRVWEVATGNLKQAFPLGTHAVSNIAFANNGRQLLVGGLQFDRDHSYASMELADLQTGSLGKIVARDEGTISSIVLSPLGDVMAFQIDASTVKLVETRGWRTKYTLAADQESTTDNSLRRFTVSIKNVPAVAFGPDGKTIIGEIEQGGIKAWDPRTGELKKTIAADAETGTVAAVSSDGSTVAEVSGEREVRVWNVVSGAHTAVPLSQPDVTAVSLSANGKTLAIAASKGIVIVDPAAPAKAHEISTSGISFSSVVLSPDGARVAGASDSEVNVWATDNGKLLTKIAIGGASALRFKSPDQIAVGRKDGTVSMWNIANGSLSFEAKKHDSAINAIAFSADGALMATGGDDRTAIIWEMSSGKARRTLKGHDLAITSLAFSPDATTLAVGTGNASVVLWRVETGKLDRVVR